MQNEKIEDSRSWRGGVGQPRLEVRPRPRDRARADRARAVRGRVQPVRPRALRLERVSERPRAPGLLARGTADRQGGDGRPDRRRIDKDALVVVVDVKLPYPGGSTAYYDAVGQCNVLIAKAIQDAGAELCLPTSRRVDIKK